MVSRRPVESSGQMPRHADHPRPRRACRDRARHGAASRAIIELLAHARADLLRRSRACRSPGSMRRCSANRTLELAEIGFDRRLHVRILQLAGERAAVERDVRDAPGRARRPPPDEDRSSRTARANRRRAPRCMRRLTKAAPIGGASLCSFCSSSAYSGGRASGMVAISWATFIIGPLRPPSARASAAALPAPRSFAPISRAPRCAPRPRRHSRRRAHSARRGRRSDWPLYPSSCHRLKLCLSELCARRAPPAAHPMPSSSTISVR